MGVTSEKIAGRERERVTQSGLQAQLQGAARGGARRDGSAGERGRGVDAPGCSWWIGSVLLAWRWLDEEAEAYTAERRIRRCCR